ncbi:oxidoreductase [Penicillium lagena]|uniref:oxidoreductase n=1 Tax=Penicillium lagena TaxID=94218 RepID=UPI00254222EB|nr:oxidoreductase [Penicillium lagena]KAJ5613438.1 oxidoreductase [Penicillium lagena]
MSHHLQDVTVVGIGNIGAAVSRTLLKSGSRVTIWNRTASRIQIQSLISDGATFEPDIEAAIAKGVKAVLFCVLNYDAIYQLLDFCPTAIDGKILVNFSNGTPRQAIEMQTWTKRNGAAQYFDGAIMATPQLIGTPSSTILCSGETQESFQVISGLLEHLGQPYYDGPDAGAAESLDIAALLAMFGMFSGALVGMGLLSRTRRQLDSRDGKVSPSVNNIVVPVLQMMTSYVGRLAELMDEKAWDNDMGNALGMQLDGLRNALRACKEEGVDESGLKSFESLMQQAVKERGGNGGLAQVIQYILKDDRM